MVIKQKVANLLSRISISTYYKIAYYHNRRRRLLLDTPRDISEYVISKIVSKSIDSNYFLADKYLVREYVIKKGLKDILIPIYGAWGSISEIDYDQMPQSFILKMNYGAGMNFICKDKSKLNIGELNMQIAKWFDKGLNYIEPHYNLIDRKIICEELLQASDGYSPIDYKFFCVWGKVVCILACAGRYTGDEIYQTYSPEWEYLPMFSRRNKVYQQIIEPDNLKNMISVANQLAIGLDFVRVDLYSLGGKIFFGELTLTPAGGVFHGWSQEGIDFLGRKINELEQ